MGWYEEQVVPRVINVLLGNKAMGKLRARAMEGLSGEVVEIGFGSGTNVPYYPAEVTRVLAVDPSGAGRKLAAKRLAASRVPVEFAALDAERLPFDDASADNVLSTWTICTIPDAAAALEEIHRVLKPGGRLYFLEHGLSDDPKIAARQHRYDRIQQKIAGGCHLDRDHSALVNASSLELERVANFMIAGPKAASYMYAGTARKTS